jgi:hypothetical protein
MIKQLLLRNFTVFKEAGLKIHVGYDPFSFKLLMWYDQTVTRLGAD